VSLRWLFFDLNSYFASVEQQENPRLRGKPVAVVPALVDSTCCIAASYEAKAFGIKTGTMVSDAKILCPDIVLVEGRHDLYVQYHHAIVEAVESCMPVDVVLSIDEMAGRLHGSEQNRENAIALAQRIKTTVQKQVGAYMKSSIGIAPNRYLAKVAGDMKKPDGLTVLELKDLPHALFRLNLRDFPGIGKNMEHRLHKHGILTSQALCAQDDKTMREIWGGIGGSRFAAWLRGEDLDVVHEKNKSLGHSHVLEPAVRSKTGAYNVAKYLLSKAARRLRRIGYWSGGLSVAVRFRGGKSWKNDEKLSDVQDTPTLLKTLSMLWDDFPNNEDPVWVGVTLSPLVPPNRHTLPLFDNNKRETLSNVMDSINEKYGKNTAVFAALKDVSNKTAPTRISFQGVPNISDF
jgi:DNA polymerase-4